MNQSILAVVLILSTMSFKAMADESEYYDSDDSSPRRQIYSYDPSSYNPSARDFTERCMRLAQYSGEKACDVFNICCSEDNVLNKLNGDKCQISDPTNGCNLDMAGTRIQWSQCRAFNCTTEVTTTTTTTPRPISIAPPPMISLSSILMFASTLIFAQQR